jgi:lysozyme
VNFTPKAKALLQKLEGCRLKAYLDTADKWTIGWGHTGPEVTATSVWSQERADATLDRDLKRFTVGVAHLLENAPTLSDDQYSALVIFAYNVGLVALARSTLLRVVDAGHFEAVPTHMRHWVHVHDRYGNLVVDPGLVKRRDAEIELWLEGTPTA